MTTPSEPPKPALSTPNGTGPIHLPRLTITFCTGCKWNLRAAYYAQELLQTFGDQLGEVALVPDGSGGVFRVLLYHAPSGEVPGSEAKEAANGKGESEGGSGVKVEMKVLWDRKVDGGFPETKVLKGRVRDVLDPSRGLGHTDRALGKDVGGSGGGKEVAEEAGGAAGVSGKKENEARGVDAEGNAETSAQSGSGSGGGEECVDCK
jgi:selT/selW/selH-like putative selenoprotein